MIEGSTIWNCLHSTKTTMQSNKRNKEYITESERIIDLKNSKIEAVTTTIGYQQIISHSILLDPLRLKTFRDL